MGARSHTLEAEIAGSIRSVTFRSSEGMRTVAFGSGRPVVPSVTLPVRSPAVAAAACRMATTQAPTVTRKGLCMVMGDGLWCSLLFIPGRAGAPSNATASGPVACVAWNPRSMTAPL